MKKQHLVALAALLPAETVLSSNAQLHLKGGEDGDGGVITDDLADI